MIGGGGGGVVVVVPPPRTTWPRPLCFARIQSSFAGEEHYYYFVVMVMVVVVMLPDFPLVFLAVFRPNPRWTPNDHRRCRRHHHRTVPIKFHIFIAIVIFIIVMTSSRLSSSGPFDVSSALHLFLGNSSNSNELIKADMRTGDDDNGYEEKEEGALVVEWLVSLVVVVLLRVGGDEPRLEEDAEEGKGIA